MDVTPGISGASRHALAVGFIAENDFLPAKEFCRFAGWARRGIPKLMLVMLTLRWAEARFRVASKILACQDCNMALECPAGLTAALFAINLVATFGRPPVVTPSLLAVNHRLRFLKGDEQGEARRIRLSTTPCYPFR